MATPPSHSQSLLPNPDILILDNIEREADRFRLNVHTGLGGDSPRKTLGFEKTGGDNRRTLQSVPRRARYVALAYFGRPVSLRARCGRSRPV